MKQFNQTQLALLQQLADGQCHSGNTLGERLGVSRTAIWKQISQLAEWGLIIKRLPQQGYQLTNPLILLNEEQIKHYLIEAGFNKASELHLFASIDSTNRYLKELPNKTAIRICCAETQTQGRGRFGRQWISPFGENIYCSSRWELNCCLSQLSGLSLVVGLAIIATLMKNQINQDIRLKWPNDILWGNSKLCGILIEVIAETNASAQVIIGIGININTATKEHQLLDKPWCSLYEMTGKLFDRNRLIAQLIHTLDKYLDKFLDKGFASFIEEWQQVDYLKDQLITVSQPTGYISGQACGINELGQLGLKDEQGKIHYLSSGDTSINGVTD